MPNFARGFSLVELMVALAISLFLLLGITQIYLGSSATNRAQEGLSRVQENARFANSLLNREMRMVGYTGCIEAPRDVEDQTGSAPGGGDESVNAVEDLLNGTGIEGHAAGGWDSPSGTVSVVNGTEAVTLRGGGNANVLYDGPQGNAQFDIRGPMGDITIRDAGFYDGERLIVSDCESADIVEMVQSGNRNVGRVTISAQQELRTELYEPGEATVLSENRRTYFIGTRGDPGDEDSDHGLYVYRDAQGEAQELVSDISDMRIDYGIDSDASGRVNEYRSADEVSAWEDVISVRVGLLVRSDEVMDEVRQRDVDLLGRGSPVSFSDRRIRQEVTATVSLRNRLP